MRSRPSMLLWFMALSTPEPDGSLSATPRLPTGSRLTNKVINISTASLSPKRFPIRVLERSRTGCNRPSPAEQFLRCNCSIRRRSQSQTRYPGNERKSEDLKEEKRTERLLRKPFRSSNLETPSRKTNGYRCQTGGRYRI